MRIIVLLFLLIAFGCKSSPKEIAEPFEYRFEKSVDRTETAQRDNRKVTVVFDGVPFGQAMSILTQETNAPIVWSSSLDGQLASGAFSGAPLASVLDVLARRCGSSVAEVGGVYYLGEIRREDRAFAVVRIPPVEPAEFLAAVKTSCSMEGAVSIVGSNVWICDNIESLRKILTAVETIRERSDKSYVAEMYFIRVNDEYFVRLSAELQFRQIDIFSSAFNVEELFAMFVDGEAGGGKTRIVQRPVLYLSEGRPFTFSDGKEITRERKTLTETGAVETTGYSRFTDGLNLTMQLNRVSDKSYAVDIDLSISVFDKADKSSVPSQDKSSLQTKGIRVRDSQVYYIGCLERDLRHDKGGLFSFDFNKSKDLITVWLRVRELKDDQ
jgi:hypothetical protein